MAKSRPHAQAKTERNAAIVAAHEAGMSYRKLAEKYGITCGRVWDIVRQATRGRGVGAPKETPATDYDAPGLTVGERARRLAGSLLVSSNLDTYEPRCAAAIAAAIEDAALMAEAMAFDAVAARIRRLKENDR